MLYCYSTQGKGGPSPKSLWILFSIISSKPFQSMFIFLCQLVLWTACLGIWLKDEGRKQDLNSGSFQSLWDVLTALWLHMPCTNQVLVVALSPQPWESQSEIRKECRRVELINVTVLGRTDKGFRDSRSVFHALTETLIYYKEKKWGVDGSGGLGLPHWESLWSWLGQETIISVLLLPEGLKKLLSLASLEGDSLAPMRCFPATLRGTLGPMRWCPPPLRGQSWVPWGGSPIPDEPHHYGQSSPLEGDMFCMLHHCLVALPVGWSFVVKMFTSQSAQNPRPLWKNDSRSRKLKRQNRAIEGQNGACVGWGRLLSPVCSLTHFSEEYTLV